MGYCCGCQQGGERGEAWLLSCMVVGLAVSVSGYMDGMILTVDGVVLWTMRDAGL
jgi:hypothetical protein